jgi:hypothetical protein
MSGKYESNSNSAFIMRSGSMMGLEKLNLFPAIIARMFTKNAIKNEHTSTTCFADGQKKAAVAMYLIDHNNSELAERYAEPK